ncbi:MAG: lytic murein transglycosylase [Candidatus Cloacimonetes bacterium]|nr:lytic murein transglycosylase [Candidatus Cloacimonadota bacterium]
MRCIAIFALLSVCISVNALQESFAEALNDLRGELAANNVPAEWFDMTVHDDRFLLHATIEDRFSTAAEHKVDRTEEKSLDWYFEVFGVKTKVKLGRAFMQDNMPLLDQIETDYGIHPEMVCAVLGMETNFAQERFKGNYYVFNSLVSQYLFMERRRRFALRELTAFYQFCDKTGHEPYHFVGSFAGASGWGQFIPSSLLSFFVDASGNDHDIDIYSLEDNVHSIANYLSGHGLNAQTMGSPDKRYQAVYAYNHSDAYVQAVLHIYQALRAEKE